MVHSNDERDARPRRGHPRTVPPSRHRLGAHIVADALIARQRFTFGDAARILGRDHSTSVWWRKCIADMKAMPVIYAYENELYIDFNSRI